jgi:hypothetical protein
MDFVFSHDAPVEVALACIDLFLMTEAVSLLTQPRGVRSDYLPVALVMEGSAGQGTRPCIRLQLRFPLLRRRIPGSVYTAPPARLAFDLPPRLEEVY